MKKIFIILFIVIAILIIIKQVQNYIYTTATYDTKDAVYALIDRGMNSNSNVSITILSADNLDEEYTNTYKKGKYKNVIGFADIYKYSNNKYKFEHIRSTELLVYGCFIDESDVVNGTTYITVDKKTGEIVSLDNNLYKVSTFKFKTIPYLIWSSQK